MSIERAWRELGELYPPAIEALLSIRDQRFVPCSAAPPIWAHLMMLPPSVTTWETLRVTYEVFLSLHKRHPELARSCASIAMPALIITAISTCPGIYHDPNSAFGAGAAI